MAKGQEHHILFTRRTWVSQESTKRLRQNRWLIALIDPDSHRALHQAIATVPVLDHYMAERVNRDFMPVRGDHLRTMDELCFSIDSATRHPKAGVIERGIGQLVIEAVQLQKPFVAEGLFTPELTVMPQSHDVVFKHSRSA